MRLAALTLAFVLSAQVALAQATGTFAIEIEGQILNFAVVDGSPGAWSRWSGDGNFGSFAVHAKYDDGTLVSLNGSYTAAGIGDFAILISGGGEPRWLGDQTQGFGPQGIRLELRGDTLVIDGRFGGTVTRDGGSGNVSGTVRASLPRME